MGFARASLVAAIGIGVLGGCASGPADQAADRNRPEAVEPVDRAGDTATRSVSEPVAPEPSQASAALKAIDVPSARDIYFDYDTSTIKKEYEAVLLDHSRYLLANPTRAIILEGNADERGSREYNLALGAQRAEAVKRALVLLGVPESRIEAVSFGEEKPRARPRRSGVGNESPRGHRLSTLARPPRHSGHCVLEQGTRGMSSPT